MYRSSVRLTVARRVALLAACVVGLLGVCAAPAFAESAWWHLLSGARPSYLHKSGGIVVATVINIGDGSTRECVQVAVGKGKYGNAECSEAAGAGGGEYEKEPVEIVDQLPSGLRAISVSGVLVAEEARGNLISCELQGKKAAPLVICTVPSSVPPFAVIEVRIGVLVETSVPSGEVDESEVNEVSVSGGGAPAASIRRPLDLSEEPVPFGLQDYELTPEDEGGKVDTQAGSHPFQTTFTVTANQGQQEISGFGFPTASPAGGTTRDVDVHFPPGLIGNPQPLTQCTIQQFIALRNACPLGSVVGVAISTVDEPGYDGVISFVDPVFNLQPQTGEPARFGFLPGGHENPIYINASVRAGSDYGIDSEVHDITQTISFLSNVVTVWGVPGSSAHNASRDGCLAGQALETHPPCQPLVEDNPPAFFELPTSCTGPLHSSVEVDSWQEPGRVLEYAATQPLPALDGCNRLPFAPSIKVVPDGPNASSPTGLTVDVHNPQEESLNGQALGEGDVRGITVALPPGVAINPSGGDGLEACTEGLVGFEGNAEAELEPGVMLPQLTPKLPGSYGSSEPFEPGVNFCANASKIGTVSIKTPLLAKPLEGSVYLASQEANPFGSLVAIYIVAEEPTSGVLVKIPGEVRLCQAAGEAISGMTCQEAGQIVTTIQNSPQAPFEDAELHFFGGERAPLATPIRCGSYTTSGAFVPWGAEPSDETIETVDASSAFAITSGPATAGHRGGTSCPGATLPFEPSSTGGALNLQAGAFSQFTTTLSREPGEQTLQSAEVKLPPGIAGLLSSVELCREPQANLGTCGPNSQIGETTVSVGVGGDPFTVKGGKVFITGPYNGSRECTVGEPGCAPFGLSVTNPAKAGPFDLADTKNNHPACDCVLVRAKIEVNPLTAALTIVSNPPGTPDSIPAMIEGIPLQIQHVNITTTRSDFQFNPTNCNRMSFEATLNSAEGGTDRFSIPFQVTNCGALKFEPKFGVSTSGRTSRARGASLAVRLSYPAGALGKDANIHEVKVELPKQLPSRLTTLQKACTAAQFKANPAGCPAGSIVGHAKALTPLLPVPLEGPAYFVSNGGEAFPNLDIVLQGYGVTADLVGDTFIDEKTGITSSTFKAIPDAPVDSFELTLPEGPDSALAASGNLCKKSLAMPTEFVAQNGATLHQSTKIAVTGCAKTTAPHHNKHKRKHKRRRGAHTRAAHARHTHAR